MHGKHYSEMGDWDIVLIDMITVLFGVVLFVDEVERKKVMIESVGDVLLVASEGSEWEEGGVEVVRVF